MQCSIKRAIIVFCCLIISHSIYAQEEENEGGFFGSLGLGYGIITGRSDPSEVLKSNIFDNDSIENETIKSYDESGKDFSFGSPLPILQLGYAMAETGTRFSLGSDLDSAEIGGLSLNMMQSLKKSGTLHVGIGYVPGKVWENPYLLNTKRKTTDETTMQLSVNFNSFFLPGLDVGLTSKTFDVKNDKTSSLLQRDGAMLSFNAAYLIPLNKTNTLTPISAITIEDREGDANSYSGWDMGVKHGLSLGRFVFQTTLSYGENEYEKKHPVFNKIRKDTFYGVGELIYYTGLFGSPKLSLIGLLNYSKVNSDITFFESSSFLAGTALHYSF